MVTCVIDEVIQEISHLVVHHGTHAVSAMQEHGEDEECSIGQDDSETRFECLSAGLALGRVDAVRIVDDVADKAGEIELTAWLVAVQPAVLVGAVDVKPAGTAAGAVAGRLHGGVAVGGGFRMGAERCGKFEVRPWRRGRRRGRRRWRR